MAAPDVAGRLGAWLSGLQLGPSTWIETLELTPLLHDDASGEPVALMHDALRTGALEVLEHGAGIVNELRARNTGTRPVLVLEGRASSARSRIASSRWTCSWLPARRSRSRWAASSRGAGVMVRCTSPRRRPRWNPGSGR
jgi:hypothetical protein